MLGSVEAVVFFSLGIEENDGRKAFDFVFLRIGLVLFGEGFVAAWIVEFDENKVFGGLAGEALLREDILAHHFAGWAPVGASELHEDMFVFFFRLGEGCFEVGAPVFIGRSGESSGEE